MYSLPISLEQWKINLKPVQKTLNQDKFKPQHISSNNNLNLSCFLTSSLWFTVHLIRQGQSQKLQLSVVMLNPSHLYGIFNISLFDSPEA